MGRNAKFGRDAFLSAVAGEALQSRPLSIQSIAVAAGATVGSLYHRFGSREILLAETWLAAVRSFQAVFLAELGSAKTAHEGVSAALSVPRWSRENPGFAAVLALYRPAEFIDPTVPEDLRSAAAGINDALAREMRSFARRAERPLLACRLALIAFPHGAVRQFLPDPPPPAVDRYVARAYHAVMARPGQDRSLE